MTNENNEMHVQSVWTQLYNPLRRLTGTEIERLIVDAQHGDDVKLQAIFQQIETQSPIYHVCIQKRTAGVINRKWQIVPKDESPAARLQADKIQKMFEKADMLNDDGLTDALRWLVMSAFKGRTAVKAFFDGDGDLYFKKIMPWNFLEYNSKFYWNPSSQQTGWFQESGNSLTIPPGLVEIPKDELCYITNSMPIDVPGLLCYLRQLVGEDQWARFVEKEGIPQVILTAPEGTPDTDLAKWNWRAMQIFEGGSGTLPYNTKVDQLTSARGQDPFDAFVQHQMEMVCILSLGGTLLVMPGSTGLGSDLARVQQESYNELVAADCKRISNALTNNVVRKCAAKLGQELLCRFTFIEEEPFSVMEYIEMATKCRDLGIEIDTSEFKKLTKLPFIAEKEIWKPSIEETSKEWSPEDKSSLKENLD